MRLSCLPRTPSSAFISTEHKCGLWCAIHAQCRETRCSRSALQCHKTNHPHGDITLFESMYCTHLWSGSFSKPSLELFVHVFRILHFGTASIGLTKQRLLYLFVCVPLSTSHRSFWCGWVHSQSLGTDDQRPRSGRCDGINLYAREGDLRQVPVAVGNVVQPPVIQGSSHVSGCLR